jgi:3-methyladenine DNA glycosylase AlkD
MTRDEVLAWLEANGSEKERAKLPRYGIVTTRAYGVPIARMLGFAKKQPKDHALAAALWKTGRYEARLLASMLDDPKKVTRAQMDAWARDFDNWGVCDTVCWHLFDLTPFAWEKARRWATSRDEFVKRAAFALMAGRVRHDKQLPDAAFLELLPLIGAGAADDRNFVMKGVSWALRRIGGRSPKLHAASVALARRLSGSKDASSRWVGRDVLRFLATRKPKAR